MEAEEKAQPGEPEEEATAKDQPLVPLQIQEIIFYEDKLVLALVERDGKRIVAVPLRQFCTHLGVDWSGQLQRMKRDEVLVAEMMSVVITPTLIAEQDQPIRGQRRSQPATCLPLDIFPGWLFTITPGRVAPEHQAKIQRYRRRCYRVLAEAFANGELFGDEDDLPPPPGTDTRVVAADDPLAVVLVERQQQTLSLLQEHDQATRMGLERMESTLGQAVDLITGLLSNQQARVAKIDERTARLTPAHAQQVQEEVGLLVKLWRKRRPELSEEQAKSWAYSHIHQHFQAPSYKEIADERFEDVMTFVRKAIRKASHGKQPEQGTWIEQ